MHRIYSGLSHTEEKMKYLGKLTIFVFIIGSLVLGRGLHAETDVPADETSELVPLTDADTELNADMARAAKIYAKLMWAAYCRTGDHNIRKSKVAYDTLIEELELEDKFVGDKVLSVSGASFIYTERAALRFPRLLDLNGAEEDARKAIQLDPENVEAKWLLAKILRERFALSIDQNGRGGVTETLQDELLSVLKQVVELDSDHGEAHLYLGSIASYLGQVELAITSFKALTRIMPFRAQYHRELGKLYEMQGRREEALHSYERVLTISPEDIEAHYSISLVYQAQNNFEKAEYHITQVITLLEEHARSIRSGTRTNNVRSRDRIVLAQRIRDARYALAQIYLRFNAPQKAAQTFEKILTVDANYVPALTGIGIAYQMLDNVKQSENYLRKAIRLSSTEELPDAYNALGYLYAEQGIKLDEAETLVRRALKSAPTSGAYLDSLGFIYFKQGKLDAAIESLEQAVRYLPDTPEILSHLADAYLKKGLEQKALQTLEHAVRLEPDNAELHQQLDTIKSGR